MAKSLNMLLKEAGVPPVLHNEKLSEHPLGAGLAKIITDTKLRTNELRTSHVIRAGSSAAIAADLPIVLALVARSIVVTKDEAYFVSMLTLVRMLRQFESAYYDEDNPILKRGTGFVVVSDYTTSAISDRERADVELWLSEHITWGGGLVIGITQRRDTVTFTSPLAVAMHGSKTIEI